MLRDERGSVAIGVALIAVVLIFILGVGLVGAAASTYAAAASAADAAALAAAPVTFRPFAATGSPAAEARRLAGANGAVLTKCSCPVDRTWRPRIVEVVVERRVELIGLGAITVRASSRAEFAPMALIDGDI